MSTVEEIKEQMLTLSAEEVSALRDWLDELDWERWDEQLERDARDGKLDALVEQARRDHTDGKSTPL